ncbi:MAG TPA: serine/threonine-protein kinase [Rhizomicrobium sp.]|nr:serine/threonine-protein kinase [Rhizomicrobium sp.]
MREWRLEEVLGAGGFGIVYRGTDIYFGESVAIKEYFPGAISDRIDGTTVTPTDSSSEEIYHLGRSKFMEEAKVLWGLSHPERHPNIVAVRSLFEIHGTAYMVMDFESGLSLAQMLRDGRRFDEKSLLAIIRPIAEGLERAHQAGVLHRDIKPANILVSAQGRPVLIDFGSARFESSQATNTKVTFYTPPYAALEQYVKSYPQGPWTDIYALGVVLYQCVTGEKPPEVLERLHGEDSKLLSAREWPGFSHAFTRAVDAAMAVRPLERPNSISSWLRLLDVKDAFVSDEVTRIAVSPSSPSVEPKARQGVPVPPPANASSIPVPADSAKKQPKPKIGGKIPVIALGFAALFAILAMASVLINRVNKASPNFTPSVAAGTNVQPTNNSDTLIRQMNDLIDVAQKAHLKPTDVAVLGNAKASMASLVATGAASAQHVKIASDMAKSEYDSLGRTERRMLRDAGQMPAANDVPGSADAIAKLQKAKADLNAALAVPARQDVAQIIDQTRLAISSFAAFQDAYGAALPVFVTAKRNAFDALHTTAKSLCDQVTALANVEKPWFLASSVRKNAYQLRQDNAVQAKAIGQQLDDLARTVATSNDLRELTTAINSVTDDRTKAAQLYASSSSAAL